MKRRLIGNVALVAVFAALIGFVLTDSMARVNTFGQLGLLVDVRHEIVSEYVEEPDQEKMMQSAVRAMVDALEDPYTVYLTPEDLQPFERTVTGKFSGIGAEIDIFENRLRIVSPLEDSPAWKSGVMAGDIVLEIEGETTEGMKINEAVKRLTGEEGTEVTILVRHRGGEEATITITRAVIEINTVRGFRRNGDSHFDYWLDPAKKIGYIRISQFNANTTEDLGEALAELDPESLKGLILDLRFNPGGLLDAAVGVSDYFLPAEETVVSIKGRKVPEKVHKTSKAALLGADVPLVVLVNEGSASASEIVSGALSDHGRAHVVGTRSFGKGSVQQVRALGGGNGAIKITNAYYYLPNGRNLHKREGKDEWGVDPSAGAYVTMTPDEVRAMIETRRDTDILRAGGDGLGNGDISTDWLRDTLKDGQLAAAYEAVSGKIATGEWPTVGESVEDGVVEETKRAALQRRLEFLKERVAETEAEIAELATGASAEDAADATEAEAAAAESESAEAAADATSEVEEAADAVESAEEAQQPEAVAP